MRHLFLTSSIGTPGVGKSIRTKLGHNNPLKTVFITTPVEGDEGDLSWVEEDRQGLNKNGFITFDYTITGKSESQIREDFKDVDVLYISGGNEFYLAQQAQTNNFRGIVREFIEGGGLYIGTSCGSVIAGDNFQATLGINSLEKLKQPVITSGFGLVNYTILPHWGSDEFKKGYMEQSFDHMFQPQHALIGLNNYQYIEIKDEWSEIVDIRKEQ